MLRADTGSDSVERNYFPLCAHWPDGTGIATVAVPVVLGRANRTEASARGGAKEWFEGAPENRLDALRQAAELLEKRLTRPPQRPKPKARRTRAT